MTVKIKITHNISTVDAVSAVHTALHNAVWKPTKSQRVNILRAIDYECLRAEVIDLNPDEKAHDRQFEVRLIEDK